MYNTLHNTAEAEDQYCHTAAQDKRCNHDDNSLQMKARH